MKRWMQTAVLALLHLINALLIIWIWSFDTLATARVLDYPP